MRLMTKEYLAKFIGNHINRKFGDRVDQAKLDSIQATLLDKFRPESPVKEVAKMVVDMLLELENGVARSGSFPKFEKQKLIRELELNLNKALGRHSVS